MIMIEYPENGRVVTIERATLRDATDAIEILQVPLQDAEIKFRAKVPGVAFDEIVKDIIGSGGVVV